MRCATVRLYYHILAQYTTGTAGETAVPVRGILILQVVVLVEFGGMGDRAQLCALGTLGLNEVA